MHVTSRLQDGCSSSNYHMQGQGKKKGEGGESVTTFSCIKKARTGNSLAIQWLGLHALTAKGSSPGWGTKIPHVARHSQKKKQEPFRLVVDSSHYQEMEHVLTTPSLREAGQWTV